jgi:hypothetical protein
MQQGAIISRNGMRLAALSAAQGFFYGYAARAARDAAKVEADAIAVRQWAARQVQLVSAHNYSDERRLTCAQWALSLKVEPAELPIAEMRDDVLNADAVAAWARQHTNVVILYDAGGPGEHYEDVRLDENVIVASLGASFASEMLDGSPSHLFHRRQTEGWSAASVVLSAIARGWEMSLEDLAKTSLCRAINDDEAYIAVIGRYSSGTRARRIILGAYSRTRDSMFLRKLALRVVVPE